jgi:hypothetical protein
VRWPTILRSEGRQEADETLPTLGLDGRGTPRHGRRCTLRRFIKSKETTTWPHGKKVFHT